MAPQDRSPDTLAQQIIEAISNDQVDTAIALATQFIDGYPQHAFGWKAKGVALINAGAHAEAVEVLSQGHDAVPSDPEILNSLGNALVKTERFADAEQAFNAAIELEPGFVEAHANLSALLERREAYGDLVAAYARLIALQPENESYKLAQAKVLIHAQQYEQASELIGALSDAAQNALDGIKIKILFAERTRDFDAALLLYGRWRQESPQNIEACIGQGKLHYQLGQMPEGQGCLADAIGLGADPARVYFAAAEGLMLGERFNEAIVVLQHLTSEKPEMALAWAALGNAYMEVRRSREATKALAEAHRLAPSDRSIKNNWGVALLRDGEYQAAQLVFEELLVDDPENASLHNTLASVLLELSELDGAKVHIASALAIDDKNASLHLLAAKIHYACNKIQTAQDECNRALQLEPENVDALNYMAHMAQDNGHFGLALSLVRRALAVDASHAMSYMHLGNIYKSLGLFKESLTNYVRGLELSSNDINAHSNMLFALNYVAEVSPATATNEARRFGELARRQAPWRYDAWKSRRAGQKIRVGFVSSDLRGHPVGYFIEALLRHLDPNRFELFAYHATRREDQLTQRVKPFFKQWECVHGMSDENLAKRIHADGVHLLFDLSGHTGGSRLSMFAFKPAPVQVAYLGYFATTGLAEIDYILGDRFVTPYRDAAHFAEKIWQLPHSYWCYTPPSSEVSVGALPAVANGHVTFGCFNNTSKLNARVFDTWAEVMRLVPGSRLLLKAKQLDDKMLCNTVQQEFAARGVDHSRVELEGWSGYVDYLKAYQRVDIGLDPFPFPGGTTSMDSLWMGVPVVAIQGDRLVGHNAETVAHNAGLGDWVSSTTEEYVSKAVEWSNRLDELAVLRAGMRARLQASPLMDGPLFAQSVGDAIEGMCKSNPFTRGDATS